MSEMTSILFADLVKSDLTAVYDLRVVINITLYDILPSISCYFRYLIGNILTTVPVIRV